MTGSVEMWVELFDAACCPPPPWLPELEVEPSRFRIGSWLKSIPFKLIVSELVIPSKLTPFKLTMSALAKVTGILTVACWSFATGYTT